MNQEKDQDQQTLIPDNVAVLEQEVGIVIEREYARTQDEDADHFISKIKNKHEGYGHVAERFVALEIAVKRAKDDIKDFLAKLPEQGDIIVRDTAGSLYGHAVQTAQEAMTMAAVAKRVVFDILAEGGEDLPMEAYLTDNEDIDQAAETETPGLDFEETETEN